MQIYVMLPKLRGGEWRSLFTSWLLSSSFNIYATLPMLVSVLLCPLLLWLVWLFYLLDDSLVSWLDGWWVGSLVCLFVCLFDCRFVICLADWSVAKFVRWFFNRLF